jgi:hypothetical protein
MNRSLLVFSIILILLGIGFDYLISLFGLFLLFPALLSSPRPRPQGTPTGSGQQAPRPGPAMDTTPAMDTVLETAPAWGAVSTPVAPVAVAPASTLPPPPSQPSFSAPLFPTSIFPTLSQQMPAAQALKEPRSEPPASRDEVLELGGLLALVKLIFG